MNIYMYNMWFGDCYRIEDKKQNLYIDFGMHYLIEKKYKNASYYRYKKIADEINDMNGNASFLLSHYHYDHYSGVLYMREHNYRDSLFETVYLPDVWTLPDSSNVVRLILLEELMRKDYVGRISLLDFVKFLCTSVNKVVLLKRGDLFCDNKYEALWPDQSCLSKRAQMLINTLNEESNWHQYIGAVDTVVTRLLYIMNMRITEGTHLSEGIWDEVIRNSVSILEEARNSLEMSTAVKRKLNEFGNEVSVVFHNKICGDRNLLFTGDLDPTRMNLIDENYDHKVAMHKKYYYVKIPHHGTEAYYYDFSKHAVHTYMVSNGILETKHDHRISKKYSEVFKESECVMCSNSNNCQINVQCKFKTCDCSAKKCVHVYNNVSKLV